MSAAVTGGGAGEVAGGAAGISPSRAGTEEAAYRWAYLWSWPIRAMHWVAAAAIVVLAGTGLYIAKPPVTTPNAQFFMGWMRFLHFAAAAVLVMTAIVRVYWLFRGNRYERWSALFPIRPREWANLVRILRKYLMIRPEDPPHYLGHNPLQQLSYTGLYAVAAVEVVTGFALYGLSDPGGFFFQTFAWVAPAMGGWQIVRFVHHSLLWILLIFIPIHVYLGIRADVMEREGTMSSIVSGGRFVRADTRYEDE